MKTTLSLLAIASTCALTACGGGSTATTATTPPTTNPGITPANLQMTVPTPSYAAGSNELAAYTELNAYRSAHGLGLLAQSTALDKAEQNHVNYIVTNQIFGHYEIATNPGFTGVNPSDRAQFAGYASIYIGEVGGGGSGTGTAVVKQLENTVYHRSIMAEQTVVDAGVGYNAGYGEPLFIMFGWKDKQQNNASDYVSVEPLDKATNVPLSQYPETPNPYADVNPNNSDFPNKTTYPVSFTSTFGTTLNVSSFTITQAGSTSTLSARLLVAANDANKLLGTNEAYLTGTAPFLPNTSYNVAFVGTVNGTPISKNWSFTTGTAQN